MRSPLQDARPTRTSMRRGPTVHRCSHWSPKIEHVRELLARTQSAQGHAPVVEQVLRVVILVAEDPQTVPVGARELVQVASVPASGRVINCGGELGKSVAAGSCEHPSWARPEGLTMASDEVHANG